MLDIPSIVPYSTLRLKIACHSIQLSCIIILVVTSCVATTLLSAPRGTIPILVPVVIHWGGSALHRVWLLTSVLPPLEHRLLDVAHVPAFGTGHGSLPLGTFKRESGHPAVSFPPTSSYQHGPRSLHSPKIERAWSLNCQMEGASHQSGIAAMESYAIKK